MLVFNIFRRNFRLLPELMVFLVDISVSSRRISFYLLSEEVDQSCFKPLKLTWLDSLSKTEAICIKSGNFFWHDERKLETFGRTKDKIFKSQKQKKGSQKVQTYQDERKDYRSTLGGMSIRNDASVLSGVSVNKVKPLQQPLLALEGRQLD